MQSPDAEYTRWIGRTETIADSLSAAQACAAAAMFDLDESPYRNGQALPPLWQWFYFLARVPQASLAPDGHPPRGGFLPPIPYPRRMFAGARLTFHRPLVIGEPASREGEIRDVSLKSGRSGSLAFVRVGYRYVQHGALCIEEEQDIVYREASAPVPAPPEVEPPAVPAGARVRTLHADSRLLFRFSALTFNAHRIHYDREYARTEEGYPGLIVHGPLIAMLLLAHASGDEGAAPAAAPVRAFSFRSERPVFDLAPFRIVAVRDGDAVTLEAQGPDGLVAQRATATLQRPPAP